MPKERQLPLQPKSSQCQGLPLAPGKRICATWKLAPRGASEAAKSVQATQLVWVPPNNENRLLVLWSSQTAKVSSSSLIGFGGTELCCGDFRHHPLDAAGGGLAGDPLRAVPGVRRVRPEPVTGLSNSTFSSTFKGYPQKKTLPFG